MITNLVLSHNYFLAQVVILLQCFQSQPILNFQGVLNLFPGVYNLNIYFSCVKVQIDIFVDVHSVKIVMYIYFRSVMYIHVLCYI
jgi:hypothetical protein